jgi:hypothetical protein
MNELVKLTEELKRLNKMDLAFKILNVFESNAANQAQYMELSNAYVVIDILNRAISCAEKSLSISNSQEFSYSARTNLANLYFKNKQYQKASTYVKINKKIKASPELQYLSIMLKEYLNG